MIASESSNCSIEENHKMKFLGTGSALPKKVVSNDDLAQVMDTSDEWIRSRTGIGMRHIAVEETTTSMAVEAAEEALADAKISGCEIDLIQKGKSFLPSELCTKRTMR